jgi:hypothetical protein
MRTKILGQNLIENQDEIKRIALILISEGDRSGEWEIKMARIVANNGPRLYQC